ncbi:hypothetical protein Q7A53_06030 [Halobacillus rhizosphaerae]|uniref:hypothetical protein n=1 Tax=Halobacillus rhizosphaerae TaxID=3064889 RepID=UPI00398B0357
MSRKLTRLEKSTKILSNIKASKWCIVNTENEFVFLGHKFLIDEEVKEYIVHNKAGSVEDYTNEAHMEEILVVVEDESGRLSFYNQNYDKIENNLVHVKS